MPPDWLVAGTYTVDIDETTLPHGLVDTADPDGGNDTTAQTDLAENEIDLTQDFGYAGDQTLGDIVWLDMKADGTQDVGEPGIPEVELAAIWAGSTATSARVTTSTTAPSPPTRRGSTWSVTCRRVRPGSRSTPAPCRPVSSRRTTSTTRTTTGPSAPSSPGRT